MPAVSSPVYDSARAPIRLLGGLTLQPLSVAHVVILQRIDSPFLADSGGEPAAASRKGPKASTRAAASTPPVEGELDTLAAVYLLSRSDAELDVFLSEEFDRAAFDRNVIRFAIAQPAAMLTGLQSALVNAFRQGGAAEAP